MKKIIAILFTVIFISCSHKQTVPNRTIFCTITPQKYFIEKIVGGHYEVIPLIDKGQNHHTLSPTPSQIAALSNSTLFFTIGLEGEKTIVDKIKKSHSSVSIVDLLSGLSLRYLEHDHEHCDHDHAGHNSHIQTGEMADPHVWLSPKRVKIMAATIYRTMVATDSVNAEEYKQNLVTFTAELDSLDNELSISMLPYAGRSILVYHEAFGYFAEDYGLTQVTIEAGGKEPDPKTLARIIDAAAAIKPAAIFVQPQFSDRSARILANELRCKVVTVDPIPENYINDMRKIALIFREYLVK